MRGGGLSFNSGINASDPFESAKSGGVDFNNFMTNYNSQQRGNQVESKQD